MEPGAGRLQPQAAGAAPQQRLLQRLRPQRQELRRQLQQQQQQQPAEETQDSQQTATGPATVIDLVAQDERTRGTAGDADGIHGSVSDTAAASADDSDSDDDDYDYDYDYDYEEEEEEEEPIRAASAATPRSLRHKKTGSSSYNVRSTRSRPLTIHTSYAWEALDIQQQRNERVVVNMSRNRPRGPATRENGLAADEEVEMWNKICQDIRKAAEKNEKQRAIGLQIAALNEKIARNGNSTFVFIIYYFLFLIF